MNIPWLATFITAISVPIQLKHTIFADDYIQNIVMEYSERHGEGRNLHHIVETIPDEYFKRFVVPGKIAGISLETVLLDIVIKNHIPVTVSPAQQALPLHFT